MTAIACQNFETVDTLLATLDSPTQGPGRGRGLDLERGVFINGATALNMVKKSRLNIPFSVLMVTCDIIYRLHLSFTPRCTEGYTIGYI
jgi:hypothetical protein